MHKAGQAGSLETNWVSELNMPPCLTFRMGCALGSGSACCSSQRFHAARRDVTVFSATDMHIKQKKYAG